MAEDNGNGNHRWADRHSSELARRTASEMDELARRMEALRESSLNMVRWVLSTLVVVVLALVGGGVGIIKQIERIEERQGAAYKLYDDRTQIIEGLRSRVQALEEHERGKQQQ